MSRLGEKRKRNGVMVPTYQLHADDLKAAEALQVIFDAVSRQVSDLQTEYANELRRALRSFKDFK